MTRSDAAEDRPGTPRDTLVIGYGNTLRRDDALGVLVADLIGARALPGVQVTTVVQLLPELAEPIASARRVIFVDARATEPAAGVITSRLDPRDSDALSGLGWTHVASPALLVRMAALIYGHRPDAWLVSMPAYDLGFGEGLSEQARAGLDQAVDRILALL